MAELVNEVTEAEDGDVTGLSTTGLPTGLRGAATWETVRSTYSAVTGQNNMSPFSTIGEKKRKARRLAVERLEEDYGWLMYIAEETGEEELYYYNEDTGEFEKDDGKLKNTLVENLPDAYDRTEYREIKDRLEGKNRAGYDQVNGRHIEGDSMFLNVTNGVLRIDPETASGPHDWELLEHDRKYRFISQSVDAAYDPQRADMEFVYNWVSGLFEREDHEKVLGELFGMTLVPDQRFKAFGMFSGATDSGKSTALNAWENVLTQDNISGVEFKDLAEGEFQSSELFREGGRMLNAGPDISDKKITETGALKTYTSPDFTYHNVKNTWGINAKVMTSQLYVANILPLLPADNGAIPRRIKHLHFPFQFKSVYSDEYDENDPYIKEADPDIEEKLKRPDVQNALLLFALEGLYRLHQSNGEFSFEKDEHTRWVEYLARADIIGEFAVDCLKNTDVANADGYIYLTLDELHETYKNWAIDKGHEIKHRNQFGKLLNQVRTHEIYSDRSRSVGDDSKKTPIRLRIAPDRKGWEYAPTAVKERLAEEFDYGPLSESWMNGGFGEGNPPQVNREGYFNDLASNLAADGGREAFATVVNAIARLNEENSSVANDVAISGRCHEMTGGGLDVRDVIEALDTLHESGVVERDENGVYHVVDDLSGAA
ncbi:hypothetical protein ACFQH6_15090 [Halobacteriaceae archaeon GCM10025711]